MKSCYFFHYPHQTQLYSLENGSNTDQSIKSGDQQYWISTFRQQSSAYIDLKNSRLNVKLRLTNNDGTPLKGGELVGLVNLPLQTVLRQVDVTFQQTHTGTNYPYKAYIDNILKTNLSTQENLLTSQLFYKDKGPDTNDAKTGSNRGLFE